MSSSSSSISYITAPNVPKIIEFFIFANQELFPLYDAKRDSDGVAAQMRHDLNQVAVYPDESVKLDDLARVWFDRRIANGDAGDPYRKKWDAMSGDSGGGSGRKTGQTLLGHLAELLPIPHPQPTYGKHSHHSSSSSSSSSQTNPHVPLIGSHYSFINRDLYS